MDFRLGERSEEFRHEARQFLDEVLTEDVRDQMERDRGPSQLGLPPRPGRAGPAGARVAGGVGGQGRDPMEMLAFVEEFQRAGAPTYGVGTTLMVANIIRHVGTEEQKQRHPAGAAAGRSSSCSASPSPSRDPTWPPPRPGRCATGTSG